MNHRLLRFGVVWCAVLFAYGVLSASGVEPQCVWTNVARIVAVGDVHGDCDQLVRCLQAAQVIDGSNRWIAGSAHLVQTGDVLGRGPTSKQAMELLMQLEQEVGVAGGHVHALIGNHEKMVLDGR